MKKFIVVALALILVVSLVGCQNEKVDANNNAENNVTSGEETKLPEEVKEDTVTISFDVNGGEAIEPAVIKKGEAFTFPTPTKAGYRFTGWSNVQGTVGFIDGWEVPGDVVAFANWEKIEPKVIATLNNGDKKINVYEKIEVPESITKDSNWNLNKLISEVEYDTKKLLDEKLLCHEGVINSNNEEHKLKVYFLGYRFNEYSTAIFEIEVDDNVHLELECDKVLLVDCDENDGYTEVIGEDIWELGCECPVFRLNGTEMEQSDYFSVEKGI